MPCCVFVDLILTGFIIIVKGCPGWSFTLKLTALISLNMVSNGVNWWIWPVMCPVLTVKWHPRIWQWITNKSPTRLKPMFECFCSSCCNDLKTWAGWLFTLEICPVIHSRLFNYHSDNILFFQVKNLTLIKILLMWVSFVSIYHQHKTSYAVTSWDWDADFSRIRRKPA